MLPHSLGLSRAIARTMMPDRVRLFSEADLRWEGPCNLQSQKEQIVETIIGTVFMQVYALIVPVEAPTFGWNNAKLVQSANPELLEATLVVQTRPMDSYAALKRFAMVRQQ